MNPNLIIGIASDHAGYSLKELIKSYFESRNLFSRDFGTNSTESCDYPDYIHPMGRALEAGDIHFGVAICGSANGVCITANKYQHVRAALCWEVEIAELARRHNNANVLCLPARYISPEKAIEIVESFFGTPFDGGRHETRVNKIAIQG
jgi:ribose 5-phosphate isomerase B